MAEVIKDINRDNRENKVSKDAKDNFVDHVISVRRVTKVTKGGKRFSFSAVVVTGDKCGQIGIASGKSREVASAIAKAINKARKTLIQVPLRGDTVPYNVEGKHGASKVVIRSASKGTGVIAGGAVRSLMDALGVKDVLTKSLGSANSQNVAKATLNALAKLRTAKHLAKLRGKTVLEITSGGQKNVTA
ncbi:MAG: 30S ribosomal protein S5 [candidate division TM6 bacterium GW2011_GWF2_30_66]|jgi:small subunit ribosomal protein S5|nr:MAG: 30S ribosomal protein S5 [candidate division TM6 bacterium GW2011_GWF2_30_66]